MKRAKEAAHDLLYYVINGKTWLYGDMIETMKEYDKDFYIKNYDYLMSLRPR